MLGDIILYIKRLLKQQLCIHKYKSIYRIDTGGSFEVCQKCEKIQ